MTALPDFPAGAWHPPLRPVARARRLGLSLRPAERADLPFLSALFADLRRPALDAAAWPEPLRRAFCTSQFALQHQSFVAGFPQADFLVVERERLPVGRLYLDRTLPVFHLVEIALLSPVRGKGFGGLLLDSAKAAVRQAGAEALTLQVDRLNAGARRLYDRAGFREVGATATHLTLRWERGA